jgi:hypothetical protein
MFSTPSGRASRIALWTVLALALAVRLVGIDWALPNVFHVDENWFAGLALRHVQGDLNPHFFHVPSLYSYLVSGVWGLYYLGGKALGTFSSMADFREAYLRNATVFMLLGRLVTVLFSLGTVILLYLLGKKMFNIRTGLLAALFLTFSLEHVKISHDMLPDVAMIFFLLPAFLFIWNVYVRGRLGDYLLAGLFAGLAFTTKYGGLFLFLPLVLAHIFRQAEKKRPVWSWIFDLRLVVAGLVFIAVFFLGTPYALLDFQKFKTDFQWQSQHLTSVGHYGTSTAMPAWLFYLRHGFKDNIGSWPQWLVLGGLVLGLVRHRKKDILLLVMPVFMFVLIGTWKAYATRYLLPIAPFFILMAAVFLDFLLDKLRLLAQRANARLRPGLEKVLPATLAAVFFISPVIRVVRFDRQLTFPDTRVVAQKWIQANVPPATRIATESYGPPLSNRRYIVLLRHSLSQVDMDWLSLRKVRYVVVNDIMYSRFLEAPREFPREASFYRSLEEKAVLVKTFRPRWDEELVDLHNPTIKIYRLTTMPDYTYPGNFAQFFQEVALQPSSRGGGLLRLVCRPGRAADGDEIVKNPYLRITGSDGQEIFKWVWRPGEMGRGHPEVLTAEKRIPPLPGPCNIWLGYEFEFSPKPWLFAPEGLLRKEYLLAESLDVPSLKRFGLRFLFYYTRFPNKRGDDYFQVVILSKKGGQWEIFSKAFGGKIRWADCYVLNPFVRLMTADNREIADMRLVDGRVGVIQAEKRGPVRKRQGLTSLPDGFKVLVGYDYFFDSRKPELAGGPEVIEIPSPPKQQPPF